MAGGLFIEGAGPSTFARRCRRQFKRLGYVKKSSHGFERMTLVGLTTRATWACVAFMVVSGAYAKPADHDRADAQALDLAKQAIALRSVRGPGNQAPQVAALFRSALVAGGFSDADVTLTPVDDTALLIARWKGQDPKLKPLVILGHMDVVEAKPSDWERDPFTPVVENGLLYGRGASDMKLQLVGCREKLCGFRAHGNLPRRA